MVAIVAGQGLGLLNTSLGLLGSAGQLGVAGQGGSGEGVYVNATTGNLVVQQQDEWLVGLGPDAGISRTYNSLGTGVDDNGDNWRLGLSRQIIAGTGTWGAVGSTMVRVGEDGSQVSYTYNGTAYVSKSGGGSFDTLSWDSANNRWIWQDGDTQVKEYYEVTNATTKAARLKQVVDPDNKSLTLTYTGELLTRVTTSNGDYIDIEYETGTAAGNGQSKSRNIKSLTTYYASGAGQASIKRVSYSYDDYNRLSQVTVDLTPADKSITDGVTYWTKYTYVDTSSKLIKTLEQSDGSLLSFTYESGKVKTITDVRGSDTSRVTTFTYGSGATAGTVDITDALGQVTTLTYEQTGDETKQGQLLSIKSPAVGGKIAEQVFTYDSNGNVATVKDALGNITVYQYDANGNRTYERDAQNNVVVRTYSSTNQLLTQTSYIDRDPDGAGSGVPTQALTTRYVYETATGKTHQLRYVITAQGYVTQYVYNDNVSGNGQLSKTVQYSADAYDLSGLTASQVPTLAQMSTWSGTKAATGLPTVYSYNALGQLDTQTTYASVNASGDGLTDGTQSVTQFVYDQAGNLLKKIDGRQKTTEYLYDGLNRITSVKDPASGLFTVTSYLNSTRQTQVTSLNGLVTTSTYDQAGRLLTVARADGSTALGTTSYTYDKLGRLTAVTQPTGETSYYLYDAANRKVGQIDGEGALTEFVYDAKGQVVRTLRYSGTVSPTMLLLVSLGAAGLPSNLLSTSAMSVWTYATSGSTAGLGNGTSTGTATEGMQGEQTRWIQQTAGTTAGESSLSSLLTPITAGSRYEFSVHATATNATASLKVEYYNASGTLVGTSSVLDTTTSSKRLQGFLSIPTTPSGITQVKLVVSKSGSTSTAQDSKLSVMRADIAQATASQTQISLTDIRPPVSGGADRSQWNIYDVSGRLVKTITSVYEYPYAQYRGAVVEYRYDGAGRLTDTIEYATRLSDTQVNTLRAAGAVLTAANGTIVVTNAITGTPVTTTYTLTQDAANDRRTRVFYDADGRVTGQLDAENYYTESQYDKAGRLVRVKRYAKPITGTVADGATAVPPASIQTQGTSGTLGGADQTTYYLYNARGQVKAVIDAELFATAYEYDAAGNKTKETRYAAQTGTSAGTGTVLLGTLSTGTTRYVVADATKDHVTSYEYDDDNRLKRSVSQPSGLETVYAYDVQGNLLKTTAAVGQTEQRITTRRYDKLGRVTAELGAEGGKALAALASNATQQQIDNVWKQYGTQYLYDDSGHRIATITPDGSGTTGNKTAYYYDKAGRVTHSINALGEVVTYTYNAFGDVTEQRRLRDRLASPGSYGGGLKTQALIDAVDAKKSATLDSIVTSTYDRAGWLLSRTDTLGAIANYYYNAFGEVRSQYTPNTVDVFGLEAAYTYDRRGLLKTTTHGDGMGTIFDTSSATYDAFGQLSSRTDERGNTTQYMLDKLGRQIYVIEPGSEMRYSAWTYDAFSRVLTAKDPKDNISTYVYNDTDRSMTITLGGVTTTTRYDRLGQTVEQVDGRGNRTKYTYNADGQLTRTDQYSATGVNPLAAASSSTQYDYAGRVSSTISENSNNTKVTYDAANRVITRVVDSGIGGLMLTSQYLYDGLGNAVWSRDAAGVWTQTVYDSRGRVTSVTIDPASIPGTDSGVGTTGIAGPNLVANPTATPLNQVTTFTYNEDNSVLRVTRGAGSSRPEVTAYQYDSLGRRIKETRDPDGLNLWKAYAYNAAGNMVASMDQLGGITRYIYNAGGLVTHVIDATGAVVKTDYDANGRVTRTLAYADRISATDLASLGPTATWLDVQNKLPTTASNNAANQVTYKVYDARGQLTWSIDALGYATQREYDASGNVARVTRYAAKPTAFSTAGTVVEDRVSFTAPTLSTANASANQVDQYVYDGANRLLWHVDSLGYATRTVYPATGLVYQYRYANPVKYPSGWTAGTLVTAISIRSAEPGTGETVTTPYLVSNASVDQQSTIAYDRLGRVSFEYDALGYMTAYTYDATGHLKSKTRLTAEASELSDLTDPGNAKTTYEYDAAGQLIKVTDAEGSVTLNAYDKAGRLTDTTVAWGTSDASTTHYVLDAAGRVKEEVRAYGKAEQASTRYVLDVLGQRTSVIDARGIELAEGTSTWAQNLRQQLIGTTAAPAVGSSNYNLLLAQYTTKQEFDKVGRITKSTDALGGVTLTEYDAFGNAVKVTAPNNSVGYFYFDNNNQATWHVDPMGYSVYTEYDGFGLVRKITQFANVIQGSLSVTSRPQAFDTLQQAQQAGASVYVLRNTDKDAVTQIDHDRLGRQTKITDAVNASEFMVYDGFGNKVEYTNKLGGKFTYTYDKVGNLLTETLPVKVKQYNTDGSLKTHVVNSATTTDWAVVNEYTYDGRGNRLSSKEGVGLLEERNTFYTYDLLDRQIAQTGEASSYYVVGEGSLNGAPVETRAYDKRGNLIEIIAADGARTVYYWDALNHKTAEVQAIKEVGDQQKGMLTTYRYDAAGDQVAVRVYGQAVLIPDVYDGVVPVPFAQDYRETRYAYDANHRLTSTTQTGAQTEPVLNSGIWLYPTDNRLEANAVYDEDQEQYTWVLTQTDDDTSFTGYAEVSEAFNVTPGQRYQASMLVSASDASAQIEIHWYSSQNEQTSVSTSSVSPSNTNGEYGLVLLDVTAPAGADQAWLVIRKNPTVSGAVGSTVSIRDLNIYAQAQEGLYVGEINTQTGNYEVRLQDLVSRREYDANGNVVKDVDARGNAIWNYYDLRGNRIMQIDAERYVTTWAYDAAGNVTSVSKHATALASTYALNAQTNPAQVLLQVVSGGSRTTNYVLDAMGRVTQQVEVQLRYTTVDADTGGTTTVIGDVSTEFHYNNAGGLIWKKNTTTNEVNEWGYDLIGREVSRLGAEFQGYASASALTGQTIRQHIDTEYNGLGLTSRVIDRGLNDSSELDDHITTMSYDLYGQLASTSEALDGTRTTTTTYLRDIAGRVTSRSIQRHDVDGALFTDIDVFSYDMAGRQVRQSTYLRTGAYNTQSPDELGTLLQVQDVGYDTYGQVIGKRVHGDTESVSGLDVEWTEWYAYDAIGRVFKTNSGTDAERAYFYDANGNATLQLEIAGGNGSAQAQMRMTDEPTTSFSSMRDLSAKALLADLTGTYQTISRYDARNQLVETFRPDLTQARDKWETIPLESGKPTDSSNVVIDVGSIGGEAHQSDTDPIISGSIHASGAGVISVMAWTNEEITPRAWIFQEGVPGDLTTTVSWPDDYLGVGTYTVKVTYTIYGASIPALYGGGGGDNPMTPLDPPPQIEPTDVFDQRTIDYYVQDGNNSGTFVLPAFDHPHADYFFSVKVVVTKNSLAGPILLGSAETGLAFVDALSNGSGLLFVTSYAPGGVAAEGAAVEKRIHLKGQPASTASMVLFYKSDEVGSEWASMVVSDKLASGWFAQDYSGFAVGNYQIRYLALDAQGQVLNEQFGRMYVYADEAPWIRQEPRSDYPASTVFVDADGYINVPSLGSNSTHATLSYLEIGSSTWKTLDIENTATYGGISVLGWFRFKPEDLDLTGEDFVYVLEGFDATDESTGKVVGSVNEAGPGDNVTDYSQVPFNTHFRNLPLDTAQVQFRYRLDGESTWHTAWLEKDGAGSFTLDALALFPDLLLGAAQGYAVTFDFELTALGSQAQTLTALTGTLSLNNGGGEVLSTHSNAAGKAADAVIIGVANPDQVSVRTQRFNAYGEVIEQTDALGHTTNFTYDGLGHIVEKLEAETDVTSSTGVTERARNKTIYYYDAAGRYVGSLDANNARNTQIVTSKLDGSAVVLKEIHADGGKKKNAYDVFGDLRVVDNELNQRTLYYYDKAHHVTRIERPVRDTGAQAWDEYSWDEAGNQVAHRTTPNNADLYTERTYYDALHRVSHTVSAQGRNTWISYQQQSNKLVKTVTDANGRSTVDITDMFSRLLSHEFMNGNMVYYGYDHGGRVISQGYNTLFDYYEDGSLKRIRDANTGTTSIYEYDAEGNKTFEGYSTTDGEDFYQLSNIEYDELNRVKKISDAQYTLVYQYDAVGNRRHLQSYKADGILEHNYWYSYDTMNRFLITMGTLSGSTIVAGASGDGVEITYNALGQRMGAYIARDQHREKYTYTADGYLKDVDIKYAANPNYERVSTRVNDLMGRVTEYHEGSSVRTFLYDRDSKVYHEDKDGDTTDYAFLADGTVDTSVFNDGSTTVTTHFTYNWWDGAKQSTIKVEAYNGDIVGEWAPGSSEFVYDNVGNLLMAIDHKAEGGARTLRYITNVEGLVLRRDEIGLSQTVYKTQTYFYVNGQRVGETGNDPAASSIDYAQAMAQPKDISSKEAYRRWRPQWRSDFDQNYQPINSTYPGFTSSGYTVRSASETLQSVALAVWGDSSLWYLIAEANGLGNNTALTVGQSLVIPNKVTNVHNNSQTHRVYNASEAMGDVSPTLPDPPPQPDTSCGVMGLLIVMVIAVVVSYAVGGYVYTSGFFGAGQAAVAASSAVGAGVGSVVSQGAAVAMGMQDGINWNQAAVSALSAGISQGLGNVGWGLDEYPVSQSIVSSMASNAITQGVAVALKLQKNFDWRDVASAGLGAAASAGVNWVSGERGAGLVNADNKFLTSAAGGVAKSLVFQQRPDWAAIGANAFGEAVGSALNGATASSIRKADANKAPQQTSIQEASLSNILLQTRGADDFNASASLLTLLPTTDLGQLDGTLGTSFAESLIALAPSSSGPAIDLYKLAQADIGYGDPMNAFEQTLGAMGDGSTRLSGALPNMEPGFFEKKYAGANSVWMNENESWFRRGQGFLAAMITAIPMTLESGGRGLINAPGMLSYGGERALDAITSPTTEGRVYASLEAVQYLSFGTLGLMPLLSEARLTSSVISFEATATKGASVIPKGISSTPTTTVSISLSNEQSTFASVANVDTVLIGRSGYKSSAEFSDAVAAKYQSLYDQGYAIASQNAAQGLISNTNRAIGSDADAFARVGLRDWLINSEGIQEGVGKIIQVNRRLYDPSGSGAYRVPDVYIPGAKTILDGSLSFKARSTPQIIDFGNFSGGAKTTIIAPAGLSWGSYSIP